STSLWGAAHYLDDMVSLPHFNPFTISDAYLSIGKQLFLASFHYQTKDKIKTHFSSPKPRATTVCEYTFSSPNVDKLFIAFSALNSAKFSLWDGNATDNEANEMFP